jgi:hypothetical protein
LNWLAERSTDGAARWFDRYLAMLKELPDQAEQCAFAPEAGSLGLGLRQVLFKTRKGHSYRSLFVIEDEVVELLAVRGAGQDLVTAEELGLKE